MYSAAPADCFNWILDCENLKLLSVAHLFIYFVEAQLHVLFYYRNVGESIDDKNVDTENTVDSKIQTFKDLIDFYREESNG